MALASCRKETEEDRWRYTDRAWAGPKADIWYYNANDNAIQYASQYKWPFIPGTTQRAPCGGSASCPDPQQNTADCTITITDCDFGPPDQFRQPRVLQTVHLKCSGLANCYQDALSAEKCCREIP